MLIYIPLTSHSWPPSLTDHPWSQAANDAPQEGDSHRQIEDPHVVTAVAELEIPPLLVSDIDGSMKRNHLGSNDVEAKTVSACGNRRDILTCTYWLLPRPTGCPILYNQDQSSNQGRTSLQVGQAIHARQNWCTCFPASLHACWPCIVGTLQPAFGYAFATMAGPLPGTSITELEVIMKL